MVVETNFDEVAKTAEVEINEATVISCTPFKQLVNMPEVLNNLL